MSVEKILTPITTFELVEKTNEIIDNLGKDYITSLLDTEIVEPVDGQLLRYNGEKWENFSNTYQVMNPELTQVGGVCSWEVTHNLGSKFLNVHVVENSTGTEVLCEKAFTSENVVTLNLISENNIGASTYTVFVFSAN